MIKKIIYNNLLNSIGTSFFLNKIVFSNNHMLLIGL